MVTVLTAQEEQTIEKYVDEKYFDREKLKKYLIMHDIVGNEVFSYCDNREDNQERCPYSRWLDDEEGYTPLPVSMFVKRVPFYFYTRTPNKYDAGNMGTLHHILSVAVGRPEEDVHNIADVYAALEYMFYSLRLPLNRIFNYWINQTGQVAGDLFFQWNHYLHLCEELGNTDYFPDRFITAYNEALESAGMPPIIYEISEWGLGEAFFRNGTTFEFEGSFPCDSYGVPIMKWIGIKATNIKSFRCDCEKSKQGHLRIEITPSTVIYVLNFYNGTNDTNDYWYQVYAGPQNMQFDYTMLKEQRKRLGFTQQEVADAVETTVRTYQKWESGETTPDGHFLLRLLNWLDISDIQNAIKYTAMSEK